MSWAFTMVNAAPPRQPERAPMTDVVPAPDITRLPVLGSRDQTFPVRQVYCVGRNYADHAREMGHDPDREPPFFFRKDRAHLVPGGGDIAYPQATSDLHYEVELVVALSSGGTELSVEQAAAAVYGYGVGIDLTRRDIQGAAKALRRPWDMGKGFAGAAPCGPICSVSDCAIGPETAIRLSVDGVEKQTGQIGQMIWPVPDTIAYLSSLVPLEPGDLIFTGTPAGVGPVTRGQTMLAQVQGLPDLTVRMV